MAKLTLLQKFSLLSLLALVVSGLVFDRIVTAAMERDLRAHAVETCSASLSREFQKEFQADELRTPVTASRYPLFLEKIKHFNFCADVSQITIWNRKGMLVWAEDAQLIGAAGLPENRELQRALAGETVVLTSPAAHSPQNDPGEAKHTQKMQTIFVPIRFQPQGLVDNVLEVRNATTGIDQAVSHHNQIIWLATAVGMVCLYGLFYGIFRSASRQLVARNEELDESEKKFRHLVQAAQDGIISFDCQQRILMINQAALRLFGYEEAELLGQPVSLLIAADSREGFRARVTGLCGDIACLPLPLAGGSEIFELAALHRDGRHLAVELTLSRSKASKTCMATAIIRDISGRDRAAKALQRSEARFRAMCEQSPFSIQMLAPDGVTKAVNPAFEKLWGLSLADLAGYNILQDTQLVRLEIMPLLKRAFAGEACEIPATAYDASAVASHGDKRFVGSVCYPIRDVEGRVEEVVIVHHDVTEQVRMQDLLIQAKQEWEETFDIINDAITVHDADFNIIRMNRAAADLLGLPMPDILHRKCYAVFHDADTPSADCPARVALQSGKPATVEHYDPHLGKYLEVKALPRIDTTGRLVGIVHVVRDITDRKLAEVEQKKLTAQLQLSQKLESVGRLAGGVAHDFNNVLTAIIGFSELALDEIDSRHPHFEHFQTIHDSGVKGAALARQLLAFSRRQVLEMKVVNINDTIEGMGKILKRVIGEDIQVEIRPATDLRHVMADPGQMEQVLMNLAVNARDAMALSGRLVIETANVVLSEEDVQAQEGVKPGAFVMMAVQDTGTGITPEIMQNIFEPFFTTKEAGKGTGLGLATVFGIIRQHNGFIAVDSEVGAGTTFKVYLPATTQQIDKKSAAGQGLARLFGKETVLVAEDDPVVRAVLARILESLGYTLLLAANGEEALELGVGHAGRIDLLLTDVVMPGLPVRKLVDTLAAARPELRVVYMSAYADEAIARHGVLLPMVNYLQKPLMPRTLATKLREVLDGPHPDAGGASPLPPAQSA